MVSLPSEVVASLITTFANFAFMMGLASGALLTATASSLIRRMSDFQHDVEPRG